MEKNGFRQILEQIAAANQTTPEEVRQRMEAAMDSALRNPDPVVQQMWASIPRQGSDLTLDEFMEYLIARKQLLP